MAAVMSVVRFESMMEMLARLKPAFTASSAVIPALSSSLMRSKIRTLASTDIPMVSTMPAMPGRVSVAPKSVMPARRMVMVKQSMMSATRPDSP